MKNFEELYIDLEKDDKLKKIWETARTEEKKRNKIAIAICVILDTIILTMFGKTFFNNTITFKEFSIITLMMSIGLVFILDIMIYIFYTIICNKSGRQYRNEFKESIIKKLINNFYTDLEYFPNKQMPERIYEESKYNEYYNKYYSDDYIEAKLNDNCFIEMAEVLTQEERKEKDKNGNTQTITTTKFHGLFEKIDIQKSIKCELRISLNGIHKFDKKRLEMDSRRI